jgi:hypothetical protein
VCINVQVLITTRLIAVAAMQVAGICEWNGDVSGCRLREVSNCSAPNLDPEQSMLCQLSAAIKAQGSASLLDIATRLCTGGAAGVSCAFLLSRGAASSECSVRV